MSRLPLQQPWMLWILPRGGLARLRGESASTPPTARGQRPRHRPRREQGRAGDRGIERPTASTSSDGTRVYVSNEAAARGRRRPKTGRIVKKVP